MGSQRTVAVYVGIFVIAGLMILMWFSLELGGVVIGGQRYTLEAEFEEVLGLVEGNPVTFRGVEIGMVGPMRVDQATGRPRVTLLIGRDWHLQENAVARLVQPDLLGQRTIDIAYPEGGPAGAQLTPGATIETQQAFDIAQALSDLGEFTGDIRGLIQSIDENQERAFGAFTSLIEDNRPRVDSILEQMDEAIPRLEETALRVDEAAVAVGDVAERVRDGDGVAARLVNDAALGEDVAASAANLRDITDRVQASDGTLWRLIEEDTLHEDMEVTLANLREATEGLRDLFGADEGMLASVGALADELREALPEIREITANMSEISAKINDGEGTLGLLVNDPALYNDMRAVLSRISETFEEAEETGVIRTFLSVFFGAFV